jgi:protein-S-isoprenylcysteine O-methyltransferase Ste14
VNVDAPWGRFVGLMLIFGLGQLLYVGIVNPQILGHRMWLKKGTEAWDWLWFAVFTPLFVAIPAVANAEANSGSAPLPPWTEPAGLVLFVLGVGLFVRAMGENPFFEKTVRIQSERGHYVVDTGPYRFVRHPGYVGLLALILSLPPLLDSTRAFFPAAAAMASVLVRTALEDRTLRRKLTGYGDYATRVRYRLMPGVW